MAYVVIGTLTIFIEQLFLQPILINESLCFSCLKNPLGIGFLFSLFKVYLCFSWYDTWIVGRIIYM